MIFVLLKGVPKRGEGGRTLGKYSQVIPFLFLEEHPKIILAHRFILLSVQIAKPPSPQLLCFAKSVGAELLSGLHISNSATGASSWENSSARFCFGDQISMLRRRPHIWHIYTTAQWMNVKKGCWLKSFGEKWTKKWKSMVFYQTLLRQPFLQVSLSHFVPIKIPIKR